jgi:hypothetical protein
MNSIQRNVPPYFCFPAGVVVDGVAVTGVVATGLLAAGVVAAGEVATGVTAAVVVTAGVLEVGEVVFELQPIRIREHTNKTIIGTAIFRVITSS